MAHNSPLENMNTTHITENISQYEAARSSFFVFTVHLGNDRLLHPEATPGSESDSDYFKNAEDYIRLNVVKASVPTFTVETHTYRRGNDVVKFAGVPTWPEGSITVDDVVGLHVKDMLYAWLYKAYNPNTRAGGHMANYKKTCELMEYTQDYQLVRTWTLEGCFITGISEAPFDRENDDKRQLEVAISYDRAIMNPNQEDGFYENA